MKNLLFSLSFVSCFAHAGTVGLHLGSWHDEKGFNNTNPGVYLKLQNGLTIGTVLNSESNQSFYLAKTLTQEYKSFDLSVSLGLISGYKTSKVLPMIIPSLGYKINDDITLRSSFLPKINKQGSNALHWSVERRF